MAVIVAILIKGVTRGTLIAAVDVTATRRVISTYTKHIQYITTGPERLHQPSKSMSRGGQTCEVTKHHDVK